MPHKRVTRCKTDLPLRLSHLLRSDSPQHDFPSSAPEAPSGRKKAQLFFRPSDEDELSDEEETVQFHSTAVAEGLPAPGPERSARRFSALSKIVESSQEEYDYPSLDDDSETASIIGSASRRGSVDLLDLDFSSSQVRIFIKTPDGLLQVSVDLNWTTELFAMSLGFSAVGWKFSFRGKPLVADSPLRDMHGLELGSVVHASPARLVRARMPLLERRGTNWRTRKYVRKKQPFDVESGSVMAKLGA
eukprot:TRINITY_DN18746_c0_g1_i1.p1 TRINITY_DN18746_c0_g1~~TRINITY_DN18746_c0_g1_i1.p1  ORF type:complete len:246 (+),score=18.48 TRINITY_DN18746_c0_g1_i1:86-823(+)